MEIINRVTRVDTLAPAEIVAELDKHVVGQDEAKRAVAMAIRNRWRRQQLPPEDAAEVMPKNILMIGPTGVGKTEIARRLAAMIDAPFIKVEASKYTEVGYQGRDVESMIRDLVKLSVAQTQRIETEKVMEAAQQAVEERLLDLLIPPVSAQPATPEDEERRKRTREKMREKLREGVLDDRTVDISVKQVPQMAGIVGAVGGEEMGLDIQEMMEKMMPQKRKERRVTVKEARRILGQEEAERLIDDEAVSKRAIERAEQAGIIFLDEIDKVIGSNRSEGPDVSREGVQRDLLPIVEGSTVNTKFGMVKTDHILFIAAGAFHGKKPSELIPELQGRFPIRVNLSPLTRADFIRILTQPRNALARQYQLLMQAEGVKLVFDEDALDAIAELAEKVNRQAEDIGARRLHTVMERLLEEISFNAPTMRGREVLVTANLVRDRLASLAGNEDLSKYIL